MTFDPSNVLDSGRQDIGVPDTKFGGHIAFLSL